MNYLVINFSIYHGILGIEETSEFRELVSSPTPLFLSMRTVVVPSLAANCLAMARPTTPPPMTLGLMYQLLSHRYFRDELWVHTA